MKLKKLPKYMLYLAIILTLATAPVRAADAAGSYFVLAIGVGVYKDSELATLPSHHDAEKIVKLFETQPVPTRNRVLMNQKATTQAIKGAISKVTDEVRPGDFVVLYFAGHGTVAKDRWLFLPHDFDRNDAGNTLVLDTELLALSDRLAAAGHNVLLAVESCHSEMLLRTARALNLVQNKRRQEKGRGAPIIVTSSLSEENSIASEVNTGTEFGGWFSTALRLGLQGEADANRDGIVSVQEIREYLGKKVRSISRYEPFHYPGMEYTDQNCLCFASPEAHDTLAIVRADPARARLTDDQLHLFETPLRIPAPDIAPRGGRGINAPIGFWRLVSCKCSVTGNRLELPGSFTLTIRKDGTYTAVLKETSGQIQESNGRWELNRFDIEVFGRSVAEKHYLLLTHGVNDELQIINNPGDTLTFRLRSHPLYTNENMFEFKKIKD